MRVFVTGGSGYLGRSVIERLVGGGHDVLALARSESSVSKVERSGAVAVTGDLGALDVLGRVTGESDVVVHLAVDYFGADARSVEQGALAAMLATGVPMVYSSTGQVYPDLAGAIVDESQPVDATTAIQPTKALGEAQALELPSTTVIRAGLIYGRGGSLLIQSLLGAAKASGVATCVGDGANTWGVVHVDDLADLYRLAIERPVPGVYNAVSDEFPTMRAIVDAIAANTGVDVRSIPLDEAVAAYGTFAYGLVRSSRMSAAKARTTFGWEPQGRGVIDDITQGSYT